MPGWGGTQLLPNLIGIDPAVTVIVEYALAQYKMLPGLAGEFALITIDNGHDHTKPCTFGLRGLASLDAALDEIAAHTPAPAAIGVTGTPFIFAVGADLSGFGHLTDAAQARWSPSPRSSSAWCPAGVARSCCRT